MVDAPLTYLVAFVVALGVLVVVHEFGHFSVARLCGVKVLRFSVGFGKVLWKRNFGADGTELTVCAIPLGGYVKMLDEREGPVDPAELPRAFTRQSLGRRSLIVLAGPIANLLLAIVLYCGLFMHGVDELKPVFDAPPAATAAARAGLQAGDIALAADGQAVRSWEGVRWHVLRDVVDGTPLQLRVLRADGRQLDLSVDTSSVGTDALERDPLHLLGLGVRPPPVPPIVGRVLPGTPAASVGLRPGDRILAIDGTPVTLWREVAKAARGAPGRTLTLTLERAGTRLDVAVTPERVSDKEKTIGRIGFAVKDDPALRAAMLTRVTYAPLAAIKKAVVQTWETSVFTLRMMGRMVIGQVSLKNLSGPLTIADYAGQSAQLGMPYYVKFLALISISIGVLNLLPIPVLDGGHLMYHLAEFLRGKPLPERVLEIGQRIGLTLLLFMMGVALFNDLNRQFFG